MIQYEVFAVFQKHAAHRYRMTELVNAQMQERAVKSVKGWKGKLPNIDGRLATKVRSYHARYKSNFYMNGKGILMRTRVLTEAPAMINDMTILPQLFQMEALHLAHDQQAHVGKTKTVNQILEKFDWPGLHKVVTRYVNSCLVSQSSKPSKKRMKFPLKSLQSGAPNDLVQIDHLKLSKAKDGNLVVLMMVDHSTKFAQTCSYRRCDAEEACEILMENWIHPYGAPLAIQCDNGSQFFCGIDCGNDEVC